MTAEQDGVLALIAESLDDIERTRVAAENRHRSLIQVYGMAGMPQEQAAGDFAAELLKLEKQTILRLQRAMKAHPLGPWVVGQRGVGLKQAARLLAAIGDPYWNTLHDRPRTVSELWAYCGYHVLPVDQPSGGAQRRSVGGDQTGNPDHSSADDQTRCVGVAAKRRKGAKSNWSTNAKMRAFLIAEKCSIQLGQDCKREDGPPEHGASCKCSPFRLIYERRRAHTSVTHPDWEPGHSHNDGLRITAKEVLKALWIEARALHEPADEQEAAA